MLGKTYAYSYTVHACERTQGLCLCAHNHPLVGTSLASSIHCQCSDTVWLVRASHTMPLTHAFWVAGFCCRGNNAVRRVKASTGFIERVVNNITPLTPGSAGDAAANALASRLNTEGSDAAGLAFGASGTILYVTDTNNGVVKQVACT